MFVAVQVVRRSASTIDEIGSPQEWILHDMVACVLKEALGIAAMQPKFRSRTTSRYRIVANDC